MSNQSEQDLDRVISFREWCARNSLSEATGRRLLASKKGPIVTRLSERRIGIRERDYRAWLDARAS
jgi:predicted DNA-binding transcriptional regulator AlpA